ncbi:sialidase family protein [Planctomycetota bacterium]
MKHKIVFCALAVLGLFLASFKQSCMGETAIQKTLRLPPKKGNPRNGSGDFVQLKDGRLLYVYTHFTGGSDDHATAHLAGRYSSDGGVTWTKKDITIVKNEGKRNVMSVSLLRLRNGTIAMFYLRKHSLKDCRPVVRFSVDEAATWSKPQQIIPDSEISYYVLNNDRVVQLKSGRILAPVSRHDCPQGRWTKASSYGTIMCYFSDDNGRSWNCSRTKQDGSPKKGIKGEQVMLQEPGVVELKNGRLMMFCRTESGSQFLSYSSDQGVSWEPFKSSNIISPRSPASIERIPNNGDLVLVWNNHKNIAPNLKGKRTPFCVALSRDEGATWKNLKVVEDNPHGWYCYTAIHFVGDYVLLSHTAGDRRRNNGLAVTQITRFPVKWLYTDSTGNKNRK